MSIEKKAGKTKPLWRGVFLLAMLSAFLTASYKALDNLVAKNIFVANDALTAGFSYLVVGSVVGLIMTVVLAPIVGKRIVDPDFEGISWGNKRMHFYAIITGVTSAVATLFFILGSQLEGQDPSATVALSNIALIYTALYDFARGELRQKRGLLPLIALTMVGAGMVAYSSQFGFTLLGLLFIGVISSVFEGVNQVFERDGVKQSVDGVTFFFWRFLWLAMTSIAIAVSITWFRGYLPMLAATIMNALPLVWVVMITMSLVFLAIGLRIVIKKELSASIIMAMLTVQIVIAFPITWLGNIISSGIFGTLEPDPIVWIVRIVGAGLVIYCVNKIRMKYTV